VHYGVVEQLIESGKIGLRLRRGLYRLQSLQFAVQKRTS
jgi:hypothetical protein